MLDDELAVVADADAYLRHVRFGRDGSELTTKSYAGGITLFLRWCARTDWHWHAGVEHLGLFMVWLAHAGPEVSGIDASPVGVGEVLSGPGREPVRGARRVNGVLAAVRGFVVHAVDTGQAPGHLVPLLYARGCQEFCVWWSARVSGMRPGLLSATFVGDAQGLWR